MLPLRDQHRVSIVPYITIGLIAINALVFFHELSLSSEQLDHFIRTYAATPSKLSVGMNLSSAITSLFIHSGFLHIISNMLFLYIFGPSLEERFGHLRYLMFYFIIGIISVVGQVASDPLSPLPMLGASGAISGLLGSYILLFPEHKVDILFPTFWFMGTVAVPAGLMLLYWFLTQYLFGIGTLNFPDQGGVAYLAHISGFISGLLLTPIFAIGTKKFSEPEKSKIAS